MSTPNVIGYVTELVENRPFETRRDASGRIVELIPGETQVLLKLRLKNTVGEIREILVPGPSDLSEFFSAGHTREDMAKILVG
jgi:hypothetical protein